jgi:hypothetical protein
VAALAEVAVAQRIVTVPLTGLFAAVHIGSGGQLLSTMRRTGREVDAAGSSLPLSFKTSTW